MATKNSTGRLASKVKRSTAAPAAAFPSDPQAEPGQLPNYYNLLNGLFNLKGVLRLAAAAVYCKMDGNPALEDADGALTLAQRELARIYGLMSEEAVRQMWTARPDRQESYNE